MMRMLSSPWAHFQKVNVSHFLMEYKTKGIFNKHEKQTKQKTNSETSTFRQMVRKDLLRPFEWVMIQQHTYSMWDGNNNNRTVLLIRERICKYIYSSFSLAGDYIKTRERKRPDAIIPKIPKLDDMKMQDNRRRR